MKFCIADSFSSALGKLSLPEQKAVKITVFDLQQDPSSSGLRLHRIDGSKDPNFWSIRANRDIRIIIHKTAASFLICYVDHHDDAYKWAERRRIEAHPRTGVLQVVEVRERVEEISTPSYAITTQHETVFAEAPQASYQDLLFDRLSQDELLEAGVPVDWIDDIQRASDDTFLALVDHIPAEATEALLEYVSTGILKAPEAVPAGISPMEHPDAQRRFRVLENVEELTLALEYPWDKWAIFLHPSQRKVVEQDFIGPARVSGSAGTGKTVVALHRTARILNSDPSAKVLLTSFSSPLSNSLKAKLCMLLQNASIIDENATILSFQGIAHDLFTIIKGYHPRAAKHYQIQAAIKRAAEEANLTTFTDRFIFAEWLYVFDAWQLKTFDEYSSVPRLGRKNRLGLRQREKLWPVLVHAREMLENQGIFSWSAIFGVVSDHYKIRDHKPFTHIIVDEAQDLGVPELRMMAAIAGKKAGALFFAGDLGQRIFQEPFSWQSLGVDIRGRSFTLKVNYRTSHQIRESLDKLLPTTVRDVDGNEEKRGGTVSLFNGPSPSIQTYRNSSSEIDAVANWIKAAIIEGLEAAEIGVFVRSNKELTRARNAIKNAGQTPVELSDRVQDRTGRISLSTMHLAKGLEFKAVAVMACDEDILPSQIRIETVTDEAALDEVYTTERHLLYVACTRAREKLIVTGVKPASEFLSDIIG